jgi:hypothetical protein
MTRKPKESKIFDLKPQLTLAMKLAATFAITYYGLLFLFEIVMLVMYHYSIDSYYLGNGEVLENRSKDFVFLVIEFVLTGLLVFSLIQIFRKKVNGKAFFVGFSILLIGFQLYTSGVHPWLKYALEVLMVLIITPVRMKKRVKIQQGKIMLEDIEASPENPEEQALDTVQEPQAPATPSSNSEPLS